MAKIKNTFLSMLLISQIAALASAPVPGQLISRSERLTYFYVGDLPASPLVAPPQGEGALERNTTYRRIEYSGDFYNRLFYGNRFTTNFTEVTGAKVFDPVTGEVTAYPIVQRFNIQGSGCTATKGSPLGSPSELINSIYPFGYEPSREMFDVGFQGTDECHIDYGNGYTYWYRDNLRIEYLDPDTQSDAMARGSISNGNDSSSFHRKTFGNNHFEHQKSFYSAKFAEGCGQHRVRFVIKKQPLGGGTITETINEVIMDLGMKQETQEFSLPIQEGYMTWVDPAVLAFPMNCSECSSHGGEPGHGGGPQPGSIDWSVPLGTDSLGRSLGTIRLYSETLIDGLDLPTSFVYHQGPAPVEVVDSALTGRRQFKTPAIVAELNADPSGGSSLSFYRREAATGIDPEGFSTFSEDPYLQWQISMTPTGDPDQRQLDVVKNYNNSQVSYQFTEDLSPNEGFRFQRFVGAGGLQITEKTYFTVPGSANQERVVTVVKNQDDTISSVTEEIFEQTEWGHFLVEVTLDPQGVARTTSHTYQEGSWGDIRKTTYLPDGTRVSIIPGIAAWGSSSRNVSVPGTWGGWTFISSRETNEGYPSGFDGNALAEINSSRPTRSGSYNRITRRYTGKRNDLIELDGDLFVEIEIQESRFLGSDSFDGSIWWQTGWNDPTNLKSYRRDFASGPLVGRPAWHKRVDGTVETWSYLEDQTTGTMTVVHHSGAADPTDETLIIDGVRRTTETTSGGIRLLEISEDIATSLVLTHYEVLDRDSSGRPTQILHLDDSIETRSYSNCCGQLESVSRHGRTITYGYDALGRRISETRDGLTFFNDYDADGRLLRTTRYGADETPVVILEQTYNLAGELTSRSENGLSPTHFDTEYPGLGLIVKTTTLPDGGTIIETTNPDGSRASVGGTASVPSLN